MAKNQGGTAKRPTEGWHATDSLTALTDFVGAAARLNHVVARRVGISETKYKSCF